MSTFRVMTFNVNGSTYGEGPHGWEQRAMLNVQTILRYQPDLIGFQELQSKNLETYQESLTGYNHVIGNNYGDVEPTEWTSIFWKADRFELIESGEFWFSTTPDVRSVGWDVEYPMGATWVMLRRRDSDTQLLHLNTHLDDESSLSRIEASALIIERLLARQKDQVPVVVTGDFNCNPWSTPYRRFLEAGFVDSFRSAGHGDAADTSTFHGFRGRDYFALEWGGETFWRIDWVLARGGEQPLQTTSCTIVHDAEPPLYPSDHYPVVAEFQLLD